MEKIYGVTMGDSSGIGPEVLLKAWSKNEIRHPIVVYGDIEVLEIYNDALHYGVTLHRVDSPAGFEQGVMNVLDLDILRRNDVTAGRLSARSGQAAREYVVTATRAALAGDLAAVITLPMNKAATQLTDPQFTGHTELVGELCGAPHVTIMLVSDSLIVSHVSTHVSLAEAIRRVKKERIATIIGLTSEAVELLKGRARIAVAGLNPHAGDNGLFGDDEIREILPAIEWAQNQGFDVDGPFPPDTLFYTVARKQRFDAIVCMYHDQGHIPMKLLDFEGGVNVTLGLPIIRTSVDHGTAFDIAGQGVASTRSFMLALNLAASLSSQKGKL
jgi:4-phospho-D-threonate 3-dehydrogenase / 4-phospho-D-erythronate 3-dehydrogenase